MLIQRCLVSLKDSITTIVSLYHARIAHSVVVQRERLSRKQQLCNCCHFILVLFLIIVGGVTNGCSTNTSAGNVSQFVVEKTTSLQLSQLALLQYCDYVSKHGSVSIRGDSQAKTITVHTKKVVYARDQAAANLDFGHFQVALQSSAATRYSSVCKASRSAIQGNGAVTIDVTGDSITDDYAVLTDIVMPQSLLSSNSSAFVDMEATGDTISVDAIGGMLYLQSRNDDIHLSHTTLVSGSHVESTAGNIFADDSNGTFNLLAQHGNIQVARGRMSDSTSIQAGVGSVSFTGQLVTSASHEARYQIQSGKDISITLPDAAHITLDAYFWANDFKNDFFTASGNQSYAKHYSGLLDPGVHGTSQALLTLNASRGQVTIMRG